MRVDWGFALMPCCHADRYNGAMQQVEGLMGRGFWGEDSGPSALCTGVGYGVQGSRFLGVGYRVDGRGCYRQYYS